MIDPRSRSRSRSGSRSAGALATLSALALLVVAGCGSKSLTPADAAIDHHVGGDAVAGCMCQADTQTLTISWDCYCQLNNCNGVETISSCADTPGVWSRGCGFDQYTADTPGGPEIWAYDQTGKLVGAQIATDDSVFVCPDNQALQRFVLRAGQFRPASCASVTTCNCADTDASASAICVTGD